MAQNPEHTPERPAPAPALVAEHLLDSLSFSPRVERDLVVAAYHRELTDRACTAPNPESHPHLIEPATLRRLSDERIGKASKSPLNAHLDYTGRLYSDFRFTGAADGPLTTHTLLEVRLRDGTPAVLVAGGPQGERIFPVTHGAALNHLSMRRTPTGAIEQRREALLSPPAYTQALRHLIELCEQQTAVPLIENQSLLYCSFRAWIAATYPVVAPPKREVQAIRHLCSDDFPSFIIRFSPEHEFVVRPTYIHDRCRTTIRGNLLGLP